MRPLPPEIARFWLVEPGRRPESTKLATDAVKSTADKSTADERALEELAERVSAARTIA